MKTDLITAAAYIRVSTEEQTTGYSLAMQRERTAAQIAAKGWTPAGVYEDAGFSGGTLQRPALTRLLEDIAAGKLGAVVVYKLDRLSRRQRDTMYLIEDVFQQQNIELLSICESLDTSSPAGRAMIGMLSVFAQLERDTITERLSGGRRQKAGTGGYAGGGAALGYTAARGTKILLPDPEGAAAVRRVFELHAAGLRLQAIADRLNAEGRATKRGARFSPTQVMRILRRRELYEGGYSYGGVSAVGQHSALLPVIPPAGGIQVST